MYSKFSSWGTASMTDNKNCHASNQQATVATGETSPLPSSPRSEKRRKSQAWQTDNVLARLKVMCNIINCIMHTEWVSFFVFCFLVVKEMSWAVVVITSFWRHIMSSYLAGSHSFWWCLCHESSLSWLTSNCPNIKLMLHVQDVPSPARRSILHTICTECLIIPYTELYIQIRYNSNWLTMRPTIPCTQPYRPGLNSKWLIRMKRYTSCQRTSCCHTPRYYYSCYFCEYNTAGWQV